MSKVVSPAYVVSPLRTPTGKRGGALSRLHPATLGATLAKEIVKRADLDPSFIDEAIGGNATGTGKQGNNLMEKVMQEAGYGTIIHASTVNDLCGSSAQATRLAAGLVESGNDDVVLVMGVENNHVVFQGQDLMPSSNSFKGTIKTAWQTIKLGPKVITLSLPKGYALYPMGKYGDAIARERGFSRRELDAFGFSSQMKAAYAMQTGRFKDEIVTVQTPVGYLDFDEGIRPDTSPEAMAKLKPSFGKDGLHTPGTSSQISAAAAGYLVVNEQALKNHKLTPMARIVASAVVKTDSQKPGQHLIGPIDAIKKVLAKANLKIEDIGLFEINEAFASVVLAAQKELNIPIEKINVNGGAIALGHALGTSGARLPVTGIHEAHKRNAEGNPVKYVLTTLCIGGGQAIAIIFEMV